MHRQGTYEVSSKLCMQGLPKSSATSQFAEDLYNRIPRASGAQAGSYQQQERAAAAYARKAAAYTVLSDDEEGQADVDLPAPTTQAVPKGSKKQLRKAQVIQATGCLGWRQGLGWALVCMSSKGGWVHGACLHCTTHDSSCAASTTVG